MGNISIIMKCLCIVTEDNQTYGDNFKMYRNIKSLFCAPGTNIVLWINYTSKTNKQAHSKRDQICKYWRGSQNQLKVVKKYKLPVINTRDLMYNMVKIINMTYTKNESC